MGAIAALELGHDGAHAPIDRAATVFGRHLVIDGEHVPGVAIDEGAHDRSGVEEFLGGTWANLFRKRA